MLSGLGSIASDGQMAAYSRVQRPRTKSDGAVGVEACGGPGLRNAHTQRDVAKRNQVTVLNVHTLDWSVIQIGVIDGSKVLKDELVALPTHLALLPADMRRVDLQLALGAPADEDTVLAEGVGLAHIGAGEHFDR